MRKIKSFDSKRIRSKKDELYYSAGIPSRMWPSFKHSLEFKSILAEGEEEVKVGIKVQEEWYKDLMEGALFSNPYLIYISSSDPSGLSDRLGYEVMKVALNKGLQVQITNSSQTDKEEVVDEEIFMLHNVYQESNNYRIQLIRDWITKHEDCFRLVVISGSCPYEFSKRIYLEPDAMFKVERVSKFSMRR